MHRLPLLLKKPCILWNRHIRETDLFAETLNQDNVEENNYFMLFLKSIKESATKTNFIASCRNLASYKKDLEMDIHKSASEQIRELNKIILKAPKSCPALQYALIYRGKLFMRDSYFRSAISDFDVVLSLHRHNRLTTGVHAAGYLVLCYNILKDYANVKKFIDIFGMLQIQFAAFIRDDHMLECLKFHVQLINGELTKHSFLNPGLKKREFIYDNGYDAISHFLKIDKSGVHAKKDIVKGSTVLLEPTKMCSIYLPLSQCEVCYQWRVEIYTCFECRFKTYCSVDCMNNDFEYHRMECMGYNILISPSFGANNVYRRFVKVSQILKSTLFSEKRFKCFDTASAVLHEIEIMSFPNDTVLYEKLHILKEMPNYYAISDGEYSTLVTIAFRLTMFISHFTHIIEKYYSKLDLSNKQKLILIGSIIMRINMNYILNSFDFKIEFMSRNVKEMKRAFYLISSQASDDRNFSRTADELFKAIAKLDVDANIQIYKGFKRTKPQKKEKEVIVESDELTTNEKENEMLVANEVDDIVVQLLKKDDDTKVKSDSNVDSNNAIDKLCKTDTIFPNNQPKLQVIRSETPKFTTIEKDIDDRIPQDLIDVAEKCTKYGKTIKNALFDTIYDIDNKPLETMFRPIDVFKDEVCKIYFDPEYANNILKTDKTPNHITDLQLFLYTKMSEIVGNRTLRLEFIESYMTNFHKYFTDYFLKSKLTKNHIITLYCPVLRKFRHSTNPNVDLMFLRDNLLTGSTTRNILANEELTISYQLFSKLSSTTAEQPLPNKIEDDEYSDCDDLC